MDQQQQAFVGAIRNVGDQMAGIATNVSAHGVAKIIKPFDGNPKEFKDWCKSIEKYAVLTRVAGDHIRMIAYQASKGPVSDFLNRHLAANPNQDWAGIKAELTSRFAEVTDHQYALSLLRKVKQKPGETIQVYAERLMALSEDAFDNVGAADEQLIGFFIDGLLHDYMKMKVMRENPATLQAAINTANAEQNLRRRFDLRSGGSAQHFPSDRGIEPMEVGQARASFRCYRCDKSGHKAKDCRSRGNRANISAVSNTRNSGRPRPQRDVVCWYCQKIGHFANECRARNRARSTGSYPGQAASGNTGN